MDMKLQGNLGRAEKMPAGEWEAMRNIYSSRPENYEDSNGRLCAYIGNRDALLYGDGVTPFQVAALLRCRSIREARMYLETWDMTPTGRDLVVQWITRYAERRKKEWTTAR